jgi:hypothetical protein
MSVGSGRADFSKPLTVFLDESGSSGDAIKTGKAFDFGGQPIFVLAAIGTTDAASLEAELTRLVRHHGLTDGEVKSTGVAHLPQFTADLARYLALANCSIFLEVMDKRYLIVANLINHLILPPVPGFDETPGAHQMRAVFGDFLFEGLPDAILTQFAQACAEPSSDRVAALFEALEAWALIQPGLDPIRPVLLQLLRDNAADFADDTNPRACNWLPLPDISVTGRPISMLPGLSALTNIYARLNRFRGGALTGVRLVHDEHMLYGDILRDAKAVMEQLSVDGVLPPLPNADYTLSEHAKLAFASSAKTLGIQAADVLGGFVMRFVRDCQYGEHPSRERQNVMARILELSHPARAVGLNFVMSHHQLARMGISWQ